MSKRLKRKFGNDLDVYVSKSKKFVYIIFDRPFVSLRHNEEMLEKKSYNIDFMSLLLTNLQYEMEIKLFI